jgi:hypothetical protein
MAGRGGQGFGGRCDPPGPPVLLLLAPALHGWLGHLESAWALLWLGSHAHRDFLLPAAAVKQRNSKAQICALESAG